MTDNKLNIDLSGFILDLVIFGIFFIIFLVIFIAYLFHVISNIKSKGASIISNWFDYGFFLLLLIIFLTIYIKFHFDVWRETVFIGEQTNTIIALNILFYLIVFMIVSNNLITCFEGFELCYTMNKVVGIKVQDIGNFTKILNKINATKTQKKKRYFIEIGVLFFLLGFTLYRLITYIHRKDKEGILLITKTIFMPIYLVNLLTEFLTIYLIKFFKKRLLNNNYYNSNLTMQAIYNVKVSKLIFYSDFITFKSLLDFSLYFPNLVFYALGTLSLINSTIAMFIYLIYFLVLGSMYLYVDKTNKIYIKPFLRKIFFYKHFTISFGEKERAKLFEEYLLDQSDESTIMGNTYLLPLDRPIYEMENNTEKEMKGYHPTIFILFTNCYNNII